MNRFILISCAFSTILFASCNVLAKASPSATEIEIASHVKKDHDRSMTLLQEVVDINSGTMNLAGVRQVGDIFKREFQDLGFNTEWIDGASFNRAGHLLASYGNRGPRILLIGHLDTVFAENSPLQKMQMLSSDKARGPGITDMKGGDVIIVNALRALKASGQLDNMQIRVILIGDEENSGDPLALSKKALIEAGQWADIAMGFEDGDGNPKTAATSRRGSSGWQLEVTGKPAHSSQIFQPEVGDGAIYEAARILDGFRKALSKEPNLTFNPGVIVGGTEVGLDADTSRATAFGKGNVIAQIVRVNGDLRALSPEQLTKARKTMQSIVDTNLPHTKAKISFDDGYPPMAPTDGNAKLLAIYSGVSEDFGYGPVTAINPRNAGAADISFVASEVDMALDGLGLMGTGGHTVDEIGDLNSLDSQTIRAAVTLYRLSRTE
jgi:glutamate carboxypeptidase